MSEDNTIGSPRSNNVMESANTHLAVMIEQYPEYKKRIVDLYDNDPAFRSLCSDYVLCLQYFQRIRTEVNEKRLSLDEYEEVKKDLESELRSYLSKK